MPRYIRWQRRILLKSNPTWTFSPLRSRVFVCACDHHFQIKTKIVNFVTNFFLSFFPFFFDFWFSIHIFFLLFYNFNILLHIYNLKQLSSSQFAFQPFVYACVCFFFQSQTKATWLTNVKLNTKNFIFTEKLKKNILKKLSVQVTGWN